MSNIKVGFRLFKNKFDYKKPLTFDDSGQPLTFRDTTYTFESIEYRNDQSINSMGLANILEDKQKYTPRFNSFEFDNLILETKYIAVDKELIQPTNIDLVRDSDNVTKTSFYLSKNNIWESLKSGKEYAKDNLAFLKTEFKSVGIRKPLPEEIPPLLSLYHLPNQDSIFHKQNTFYPPVTRTKYEDSKNELALIPNSIGSEDSESLIRLFTDENYYNGDLVYNKVNYQEQDKPNEYSIWNKFKFVSYLDSRFIDVKKKDKANSNRQFIFFEMQTIGEYSFITKVHRVIHSDGRPFIINDIPAIEEILYENNTRHFKVDLGDNWDMEFTFFYKNTLVFDDISNDEYELSVIHHKTIRELFPNGFKHGDSKTTTVTDKTYTIISHEEAGKTIPPYNADYRTYSGEVISGTYSAYPNHVPLTELLNNVTPENNHIAKMMFPFYNTQLNFNANYVLYRDELPDFLKPENATGNPCLFFGQVNGDEVLSNNINYSTATGRDYDKFRNIIEPHLGVCFPDASDQSLTPVVVIGKANNRLNQHRSSVITILQNNKRFNHEVDEEDVKLIEDDSSGFADTIPYPLPWPDATSRKFALFTIRYGSSRDLRSAETQKHAPDDLITYTLPHTSQAESMKVEFDVEPDIDNRIRYKLEYVFRSNKDQDVDLIFLPFRGRVFYFRFKTPIKLEDNQTITIKATLYESFF